MAKEHGTAGFSSPYSLKPNLGHLTIAALEKAGLVWRVVQQNHDGLLQKAGVPQQRINEIHGNWFDPSNPVVKMKEALREDLFMDLQDVENEADLVLTLGSSLAGMNADRIVASCGKRAEKGISNQWGSVIVSLQRTPYDSKSSLRVFSTIDAFMRILATELSLEVQGPASWGLPAEDLLPFGADTDVFVVPYGSDGTLAKGGASKDRFVLDLREGSSLVVTMGADEGQSAVVVGKHPEGHYKLNVHRAESAGGTKRLVFLGRWWIDAAVNGQVPRLPLCPVALSSVS